MRRMTVCHQLTLDKVQRVRSNVSHAADFTTTLHTPFVCYPRQQRCIQVAPFIDGPMGAPDITGMFTINGGQVPTQVRVKYFLASSGERPLRRLGFDDKVELGGNIKRPLIINPIRCDQAQKTLVFFLQKSLHLRLASSWIPRMPLQVLR